MPVPVEWFIERAELNFFGDGVVGAGELHELEQLPGVARLVPSGQVTVEKILEVQDSLPQQQPSDNLSLTVGVEHYGGWRRDRLSEVPVYVHAKLVVDEYGRPEAYELNYITYYAFNGHYDLPSGFPLFRTGHHVGDWEHLTVRIDAASLVLQGVWYNAHRNIEGEWCPASRVPRTPCGRIVGFVAINGHGIYPHCGVIPRLFLLANDRTSRSGPVWNPRRLLRLSGLAHGTATPVVLSRGCSLPYVAPVGAAANSSGSSFGGRGREASATAPPVQQVAVRQTEDPDLAVGIELQLYGSSEVLLQGPAACSDGGGGGPGCRAHCAAATGAVCDSLPPLPTLVAAAGAAAVGTGGDVDGLAAGEAALAGDGVQGVFPLPTVVHDASAWQRYKGRWGTIVSATEQGWFLGPEPPVSRGLLRRLCLPCAPGVERLPTRRRPQAAAAAAAAAAVPAAVGAGAHRRSMQAQGAGQ